MSARRGATPRPALVQEAYHEAEVRLQEIGKAVRRSAEALCLDAQEEYGVITQGEYADRMLALEEQAGWPEAHAERDACRVALLAWGMRQTRTQWGSYAWLFPGATLAELEALWARPILARPPGPAGPETAPGVVGGRERLRAAQHAQSARLRHTTDMGTRTNIRP